MRDVPVSVSVSLARHPDSLFVRRIPFGDTEGPGDLEIRFAHLLEDPEHPEVGRSEFTQLGFAGRLGSKRRIPGRTIRGGVVGLNRAYPLFENLDREATPAVPHGFDSLLCVPCESGGVRRGW